MLKTAKIIGAAAVALFAAAGAHAQAPATFTSIPAGDVLLQSLTSPFTITASGQTTSGTLYSAVFSTASGQRDFFYQFTVDAATTAPVATLGLSDFAGYNPTYLQSDSVDIDGSGPFTTGGTGATGTFFSGGTIFVSYSGVAVGGKSNTLLVRTTALGSTTGNGAVIAGASANAPILAPGPGVVVPEAGTFALVVPCLLGMVGIVRRRK